jgi:hypothetical protein
MMTITNLSEEKMELVNAMKEDIKEVDGYDHKLLGLCEFVADKPLGAVILGSSCINSVILDDNNELVITNWSVGGNLYHIGGKESLKLEVPRYNADCVFEGGMIKRIFMVDGSIMEFDTNRA